MITVAKYRANQSARDRGARVDGHDPPEPDAMDGLLTALRIGGRGVRYQAGESEYAPDDPADLRATFDIVRQRRQWGPEPRREPDHVW